MAKKSEKPTFEQSIERIEAIVYQLEQGEIDLQTSLACFEEGIGLLKNCENLLTSAKAKIAVLQEVDAEGKSVEKEVSLEDFKTNAAAE